jgi:hypothetical protein
MSTFSWEIPPFGKKSSNRAAADARKKKAKFRDNWDGLEALAGKEKERVHIPPPPEAM